MPKVTCRAVVAVGLVLGVAPIVGCATNTGVLPIGPDTYSLSVERAPILGGRSEARRVALTEAGAYCAKQGKELMVVGTSTFASAAVRDTGLDVQFRCLDANDPGLHRPTLVRSPAAVIEVRQ